MGTQQHQGHGCLLGLRVWVWEVLGGPSSLEGALGGRREEREGEEKGPGKREREESDRKT